MDDPAFVRLLQRLRDLLRDGDRFVDRNRAAREARLAQAGAFAALTPGRRDALWTASGAARRSGDSLALDVAERSPAFEDLGPFETIAWDYRTTSHSPRGHPLGPLRAELKAQGLPDARTVTALADGHEVDYAGVVITRQRPGTASGVTFMTLEDETGFVNVVLWADR